MAILPKGRIPYVLVTNDDATETFEPVTGANSANPITPGVAGVNISLTYAFDYNNTELYTRVNGIDATLGIVPPNADALSLLTAANAYAFDGVNLVRLNSNSASNLAAQTQSKALSVASPGELSGSHTPAANTKATFTVAAGENGLRHICRSLTGSLAALAAAAPTTVTLALRDGASGAGAVLWSQTLLLIPGGQTGFSLTNLNIPGSADTAMTLEFSAAGGANSFESVALTYYDAVDPE